MSEVEPQPRHPVDALDGLLRKFFRSQLPHPWPAPRLCSVVPSRPRSQAVGLTLVRSRWALAAAVALLLLGSLLLPNRFPQDGKSENGLSSPMISEKPRDLHKKHNQRKEMENKPGLRADEDDRLPGLDDGGMPPLR